MRYYFVARLSGETQLQFLSHSSNGILCRISDSFSRHWTRRLYLVLCWYRHNSLALYKCNDVESFKIRLWTRTNLSVGITSFIPERFFFLCYAVVFL